MTNKELLKSNKLLKEQIELLIEKQKLEFKEPTIDKEPEFKVGTWYKFVDSKRGYRIAAYNGRGKASYGFNVSGNWTDEYTRYWDNPHFIEATKEEVEEALIKEAKKRGYKRGNFKDIVNGVVMNNWPRDDWMLCEDGLWVRGCGFCFKGGIWAEIIENKFEIAGHEVKVDGQTVRVGCYQSNKTDIRQMVKKLEICKIDGILKGGEVIEIYELKDLVDFINK